MTKIYKVIKIEDYGVVVDKIEIKESDWYLTFETTEFRKVIGVPRRCENSSYNFGNCKRIIYSIGKRLDGVPLIELADNVNIENIFKKHFEIEKNEVFPQTQGDKNIIDYFKEGYKANINKYSEEDIRSAYTSGAFDMMIKEKEINPKQLFLKNSKELFKSLQKQPIPTEVELEMKNVQKTINYHKDIWVNNWQVKITNKEINTITAVNYKT